MTLKCHILCWCGNPAIINSVQQLTWNCKWHKLAVIDSWWNRKGSGCVAQKIQDSVKGHCVEKWKNDSYPLCPCRSSVFRARFERGGLSSSLNPSSQCLLEMFRSARPGFLFNVLQLLSISSPTTFVFRFILGSTIVGDSCWRIRLQRLSFCALKRKTKWNQGTSWQSPNQWSSNKLTSKHQYCFLVFLGSPWSQWSHALYA